MPNQNPTEQTPTAPAIPPTGENLQRPENIEVQGASSTVETIDLNPDALEKNENQFIHQADQKTKIALGKLQILEKITIG